MPRMFSNGSALKERYGLAYSAFDTAAGKWTSSFKRFYRRNKHLVFLLLANSVFFFCFDTVKQRNITMAMIQKHSSLTLHFNSQNNAMQ
jgi:hypothetical protein